MCFKKDEWSTVSWDSKVRIEFEWTNGSASLGVAGPSENYSIIVVVGTKSSLKWIQNRVEGEEEVKVRLDT